VNVSARAVDDRHDAVPEESDACGKRSGERKEKR
jgi:hypothetical protein